MIWDYCLCQQEVGFDVFVRESFRVMSTGMRKSPISVDLQSRDLPTLDHGLFHFELCQRGRKYRIKTKRLIGIVGGIWRYGVYKL